MATKPVFAFVRSRWSKKIPGLSVPHPAQRIQSQDLTTFYATYNRHHDRFLSAIPSATEDFINRARSEKSLGARPEDCLWLSVVVSTDTMPKSCMRQHCKRRVKHAFVHALQQYGMDADGRALETSSAQYGHTNTLTGSLKLVLTKKALTEPFMRIEEEANLLVKLLLQRRQLALG